MIISANRLTAIASPLKHAKVAYHLGILFNAVTKKYNIRYSTQKLDG